MWFFARAIKGARNLGQKIYEPDKSAKFLFFVDLYKEVKQV